MVQQPRVLDPLKTHSASVSLQTIMELLAMSVSVLMGMHDGMKMIIIMQL
jgi:hypothetical protein